LKRSPAINATGASDTLLTLLCSRRPLPCRSLL